VQFLKGYKLHMGGFACLFLALGGVLQSASDEVIGCDNGISIAEQGIT
jgi:hypothetical protein